MLQKQSKLEVLLLRLLRLLLVLLMILMMFSDSRCFWRALVWLFVSIFLLWAVEAKTKDDGLGAVGCAFGNAGELAVHLETRF